MTDTAQAVVDELEAGDDDYVKVAIVDIDGVLRGKYLDKAKFLSSIDGGFGFCDVVFGWDVEDDCYDNGTYTGWQSGYPDGAVRIDLSTHRRIPWENDRHFFLADYTGSSPDTIVCPRRLLQRIVDRAAAMDRRAMFGMEFEWFNFAETSQSLHDKGFCDLDALTPGMFGYSILRQSQNQPFFAALLDQLRAFGVPLEGLHTETGPGVLEAAIAATGSMEAADRAVLFKSGTKELGHGLGIMPTFMARWNTELPGCSGHAHQSLWDAATGASTFFDPDDEHGMSAEFRSYLAGIVALLPDLLAVFAPTVNSYKRLVEGFWAPTSATWGIDNRTVAARVIPGSASSTRLELRVPGSDVNPYLAVAASLGAGLWGIEQGLELEQPPTTGSGYADATAAPFAGNLLDATRQLDASAGARAVLGDGFVDHFVATRTWEWRRHADAVTDWELRRYFEII